MPKHRIFGKNVKIASASAVCLRWLGIHL